jgi:hypothetical protein
MALGTVSRYNPKPLPAVCARAGRAPPRSRSTAAHPPIGGCVHWRRGPWRHRRPSLLLIGGSRSLRHEWKREWRKELWALGLAMGVGSSFCLPGIHAQASILGWTTGANRANGVAQEGACLGPHDSVLHRAPICVVKWSWAEP